METEQALAFLGSIDCDSAQGYYIARPMVADALPTLVKGWNASLQKSEANAAEKA